MDVHRCNCCGRHATKECSGCGLDVYCSVECQKEAWPEHREHCDKEVQTVEARFGRRSKRGIPTYLESTRAFREFYTLLRQQQLIGLLAGAGPFTVFAPTKTAVLNFLNNPALNRNNRSVENILKYHIVSGTFDKKYFRKEKRGELPTLLTNFTLPFNFVDQTGATMVGDRNAEITRHDIKVENGIIHRIDAVLVPPGSD